MTPIECECGAEYILENAVFQFKCFVCGGHINPTEDTVDTVEAPLYI